MPTTIPDRFFAPFEWSIESFDEIEHKLSQMFSRRIETDDGPRTFAWRGAIDASWGLHSSLYRQIRYREPRGPAPDEYKMRREEKRILAEAHRWGLHNGARGRMSVLEQLAMLQHFGAPTRLVDFSLNAYIGLWFAVERDSPNQAESATDGRLFAVDITERRINESKIYRQWEDHFNSPWGKSANSISHRDWCASTLAWEPPPFEARIASQRGAFLFSGVPMTGVGLTWPTASGDPSKINEVRESTCLALRFNKLDFPATSGRPSLQPAYTFRILAKAKPEIRRRLELVFGYDHRTLFRDFPGFAQFCSALK